MQLIWFRQDLRTHDQTALWYATQAGPTIAVVFLSPAQWQLHNDAPIKIDLYLRQLQQLKKSLSQLNIPMIVEIADTWDKIPNQLEQLCIKHQIKHVHCNEEAGWNEIQRDIQTQKVLEQHQISLERYSDRTIFPLGSIRNKSEKPYQVFGAFKKYCYEQLSISIPQCFDEPQKQDQINIENYNPNDKNYVIPSITSFYTDFKHPQNELEVSEGKAKTLLESFIKEQVEYYKDERDCPHLLGTSQLSPYLNLGILSIRQCLEALFRHQNGIFGFDSDSHQTWLDELIWREFYQHILFDYPKVSKHQPFKTATKLVQWRDIHQDKNALNDFTAWKSGQTGIPIIDAGMRQMLATGWMHNRVRMIVAMFLSKNLLIDWRRGEQWFMQHLIDGDLAANNGGWQWCASTGTDSVPYFRIFNPVSQSLKFDPKGEYIRQWVPEIAHLDDKNIHDPYLKNPDLQLNYPKPIVDLKQSRLDAISAFKTI